MESKEKNRNKKWWENDVLNLIYPLIIASFCLFLKNTITIKHPIDGFGDVLSSITSFSSIIIGFYTAMYGVLLTLSNSDFMKKMKRENLQGLLKFQLYDSLIASFLAFIISVIVQVTRHYGGQISIISFNLWVFIVSYFVATSFRSISLLLNIMFKHDSGFDDDSLDYKPSSEQINDINEINKNL